ncbi:MAG: polysaccharide pyruvyl transferase family protein [Thermoguttaceae bacterium]
MNILITGVGRDNKGSELMLCAVMQHLRATFPSARIVAGFTGSFADRTDGRLYQLLTPLWGRAAHVFSWLPEKTRLEWGGWILPKEIDVIIDASGFCFGDPWSDEYVKTNVRERLECLHANVPLIMLPQAFGPFNRSSIIPIVKPLFDAARLIFARDGRSLELVQTITGPTEKLSRAPDFTSPVQGFVPNSFPATLHGGIAVLPNQKMLDKADAQTKSQYLDFLEQCIRRVEQTGLPGFILCHQREDGKVVSLLEERGVKTLPVIRETNPLFIKGILGTCRLVIGSRYHGLINALSQGVPCIGTSWSHKYRFLFEEYDCEGYLMEDLSNHSAFEEKFTALMDEGFYRERQEVIRTAGQKIRLQTEELWNKVDQVVQQTQTG